MTLKEFKNAPYSFDKLIAELKSVFSILPDYRKGLNKSYDMINAGLAAFSVFFMQSPSFLSHQKTMEKNSGQNNAQSLFKIDDIPCDNQVRNLLDPVAPENLYMMYDNIYNGLNSVGYFEHYRRISNTILIGFDGLKYFSSHKIGCKNCNTQTKDDLTTYFHQVVTPVIVAPNNPRVIPLQPEFITPQDGHEKQDCEHSAAKRWLERYGSKYKSQGITILGDDLYSDQPICEAIQAQGYNFILTCLPDSHKTLYRELEKAELEDKIKKLTVKRFEGIRKIKIYTDEYNFINGVKLRSSSDSIYVNWCKLTTYDEDGKVICIKTFITDHEITSENIKEIVLCGRTRWKLENEHNNTLKNHSYHLEHNFGHGEEYLSQTLLTLNLLAFLFHTVLDIMDKKYNELREQLPTRKMFFDGIRTLTMLMYFPSWDTLLTFMLMGLEEKWNMEEIMASRCQYANTS